MTTNQTIDGVPRELLERIREKLSQTDYTWSSGDPEDELRALLDAPACKTCNGAGHVSDGEIDCFAEGTPYENGPIACIKDCPECKPASQPQGELVAVFDIDHTGYRCKVVLDPSKPFPPSGTKLYAEQPAPVAVALPARPRAEEEEYERMTDYEKGLLHGGIELWDKIDEATSLNTK